MVKAAKKPVVSAARSVGIPSDLPRFNFVSQDITHQEKLRYIRVRLALNILVY
jgi:hypothetical protein